MAKRKAVGGDVGWKTGALMQSDWGRTFAKPTRFVYHLPGFEPALVNGWPCFNGDGGYQGPLAES